MGILSQTHNGLNFVDSQAYIQADGTTVITIKDDGKVGIGASDPLRTLHVVGDFSVNASTSQYYGVLINGGESSNPQITIGDWHNSSATIMWDSTSNHLVIDSQHSTSGAAIVFTGNDSATEYMRITSGGNVGIGTSSPQSKLEVLGNIDCLGSLINSDFGWEIFFGDSLFFFNGVNLLGALTSDGKLGIGTSFPTAKLEVDGSVRFSTITSGILSANASGDISATSASSLVQGNIYSPVGWKLTASTYTAGGQDITSSTTQAYSGTTPVTRTSSTVFTATVAGTYEVRYQFVIKNNYADRCIVGAQVKDTSGSVILGSRSFEYLRYTTYGEYNTIQATFYTTIDANNTFNLETALRSGSLNYTLESETGANAGYISFRLIKES